MKNVSVKLCKEKTHFLYSYYIASSQKSCRLWGKVEKYGTAAEATYKNMAHAHCILDN